MNKKAICIISVLVILLGIETTYIIVDAMKDKNPVVGDNPTESDKNKEIITYQVTSMKDLEYEMEDAKYYINSLEELEKFYTLYEKIDELDKNKNFLDDYTAFIQVERFTSTSDTNLNSVSVDDNKVTFNIDRKTGGVGQMVMGRYYFIAMIPNEKVSKLDISEWKLPSSISIAHEFTIDSVNKYIVTTNMRFLTMQNDGGSHSNLYYQIDLDENKVTKVIESYKANLMGTPEFSKNEIYTKTINAELADEIKNVLNDTLTKEDINEPVNYSFFTIEALNNEKYIYNQETINTLNNLLNKIDNVTT